MSSSSHTLGGGRVASRPATPPLFVALAAVLTAVSMMTPWVSTGATHRSAFTLAVDLRQAGLLTGAAARLVAAGIAAVPFLALFALGALYSPKQRGQRAGAVLAALTGALTAATAATVVAAGGRRVLPGASFALVAGVLTVAIGLIATLRSAPHG